MYLILITFSNAKHLFKTVAQLSQAEIRSLFIRCLDFKSCAAFDRMSIVVACTVGTTRLNSKSIARPTAEPFLPALQQVILSQQVNCAIATAV